MISIPIQLLYIGDTREEGARIKEILGAQLPAASVRCTTRRAEYFPILEQKTCDVILSECRREEGDAEDVLRVVRKTYPDAPVIVLAAEGDEQCAIKLLSQGAWDYVLKQHLLRLVPAVRNAMNQRRALADASHVNMRLTRILDGIADAFIVLDRDWRITYINPEAARINGKPPEQFLGKTHWEEWPASVGTSVERQYRKAMEEGVPVQFEHQYVDDRHNVWLDIRAYPGADGLSILYRDITERKRTEAALEESERHYRLLFDTMLQGVVYQEHNGTIISMNSAAERILGKTREEFLGQTSESMEHDTLREDGTPFPGLEHPSMVALRTGQKTHNVVMGVHNPREQGYRWISISAVPLFRPGETVPYQVYTIFDDITERKRMEDVLRQLNEGLERRVQERTKELAAANRELESFSYSVSHDLRAPLRAIAGFAGLMQRHPGSTLTAEERDHLAFITTNAAQMEKLIEALLQFSRLSKRELVPSAVDTHALALEVVAMQKEESRAAATGGSGTSETAATFAVQDDLPTVQADPVLLRQVFVNLLSNAVKYSRTVSHPYIEIFGSRKGEYYLFSVRDNGVGFNQEQAWKLFHVFQRLHRHEEFEGTGVGLANVRKIVERHGGTVRAEGEEGKGATFSFTLPYQERESALLHP